MSTPFGPFLKLLSTTTFVAALSLAACADDAPEAADPCAVCMRDHGQLCESSPDGRTVCVDPWRYGSPKFDACADEPRATPQSLADKARGYEDTAWRLHVHPQLGWIVDVRLKENVAAKTATWRDVEVWQTGENDGLWNALYMAAEAYRYGATRDPDALARLRVLMASEERRMHITGVPGIFTREMRPPAAAGIAGLACPTDLAQYVPDGSKTNNKWVRISDDGCVETVRAEDMTWQKTSHCGLAEHAGWCFLDNVSQDEYAGHMFALAAITKLVDDEPLLASARELLKRVGHHLKDHSLTFVDWDGRVTEHGTLWAHSLLSGFQSAMSASFVKVAADGSKDPALVDFYERCIVKEESNCFDYAGATTRSSLDNAQKANLDFGCLTNWNGLSMHMLSLHDLVWFEHVPSRREKIARALRDDMWSPPRSERPISSQNNAFYDVIYAASKPLGPGTDGPAYDAVKNAVCMLRQFPAEKTQAARACDGPQCVEVCKDRLGHPSTSYARPAAERCLGNFIWWFWPYGTEKCDADERQVFAPIDYLLVYWMSRYYGFVSESW